MSPPLVVTDLTVTYPGGHRALDHASFAVGDGSRHALIGHSGSGKTTLVRAVLGLLPPGTGVTGSVRVGGHEVVGAGERALRALRGPVVGLVPQDPFAACDPLRTVGHHVAQAWRAHRLSPPPGRVVADLSATGIDDAARRAAAYPHTFSGGMLQRATIAAGTAHAPLLTLADEPTSALDAELADEMLALVSARSGALLLISHDPALVARHTDAVTALDEGRVVEPRPRARAGPLPRARAGPLPRASGAAPLAPSASGAARLSSTPAAEVRAVTKRYGPTVAVDGVSLAVRPGEVVGVVGRSGSGKSTLARLLAGMEAPDAGEVDTPSGPGAVMPVFQDPVASLDRRWPLWRTLLEPRRARGERVTRAGARAQAERMLARVGLDGIDVTRRPGSLSVGQAQRVAIARALAVDPRLIVADEPTAALDVDAAAGIAALLRATADAGAALLVVSHDTDRLARYADRVVRMSAGRIEEETRV